MTHWPTPVSSLALQNKSSNPTFDGSQLRSSHFSCAAIRSPSPILSHLTQPWVLLWCDNQCPQVVLHVLIQVIDLLVVFVDGRVDAQATSASA